MHTHINTQACQHTLTHRRIGRDTWERVGEERRRARKGAAESAREQESERESTRAHEHNMTRRASQGGASMAGVTPHLSGLVSLEFVVLYDAVVIEVHSRHLLLDHRLYLKRQCAVTPAMQHITHKPTNHTQHHTARQTATNISAITSTQSAIAAITRTALTHMQWTGRCKHRSTGRYVSAHSLVLQHQRHTGNAAHQCTAEVDGRWVKHQRASGTF